MSDAIIERGALDTLQAAVVAALQADHFFSDIRVLHERVQDLDYQIEQSLAGLLDTGGSIGIVCIVITPRFRVSKPNMRGPHCDPVTLIVRVMENVLLNMGDTGTKKPASLVCEMAAHILHHLTVPGYQECINVVGGGIVPVPGFLAYDVEATTQVKLERKD